MELYIRSQDKRALCKYDLLVCEKIAIDNDKYMFIADHYKNMGVYETEKRALEVLDEIQEYKDKLDEAYFLGMEESRFVSAIYEMPNE